MRTLSSTLETAQQAGGNVLYKAVFTKTGQTTRTYGVDTANTILRLSHSESEWSQTAEVVVENGDGSLTALNLTGYTATISYGYNTSAGDEYSACAPLEVIAQQGTTLFQIGKFYMVFSCASVFNMMAEDEASADYNPASSNTDTVKTILTAIANATLAAFNHCKNWTITFDSEDSLIDSFAPADYFRVGFKESRLSAFKKVLAWTRCKARIEDDGEIHVYLPKPYATNWAASTAYVLNNRVTPTTANGFEYLCTTAGTTAGTEPTWPTTENATVTDGTAVWTVRWYDYEYNDAVSNHNFFEKSVRSRLIIPNRVYVLSHPSYSPSYTGNAVDSDSYDALGRYIDERHWLRPASNAQATAIATAIRQTYQVGQERGHGTAPINCGQEVGDYILITDSAANDTRTGNIGYIQRICEGNKFDMTFRFGALDLGGIAGIIPPNMTNLTTLGGTTDRTYSYTDMVQAIGQIIELLNLLAERHNMLATKQNEIIDKINEIIIGIDLDIYATVAETSAGTIENKAVSPDSLAGSVFGTNVIGIIAVDATTDLTVADGKAYVPIPAAFNGMNLIRAQAIVITAGTTNATTIDIYNVTDSQDMLSTAISIASGATVGTVGTVNTTYDDVATNDVLRVDVTTMSTTAPKGLLVILEFSLP